MTAMFKKLNWKDQQQIIVLNAPEAFEAELAALEGIVIARELQPASEIHFMLAFVTRRDEIEQVAPVIAKHAIGDAVVWFAYPKASSKRYTCAINRDSGWQALGDAGFEPVRQVAIDEDWSALRFRRVTYIKKLTRSKLPAMSEAGKARSAQKEN
jgi:hypothetical protein